MESLGTARHAQGVALILAVAVIWIAASFLVQALENADLHPFVLTWICNLTFLIYVPITLSITGKRTRTTSARLPEAVSVAVDASSVVDGPVPRLFSSTTPDGARPVPTGHDDTVALVPVPASPPLFVREKDSLMSWLGAGDRTVDIVKASAFISPVWFIAALCFNTSLGLTSVTSNTILSSPASLFTFFLSVLILKEQFTYSKLAAVLLTISGTVLVALADDKVDGAQDGPKAGVLGDLLALTAAALYAVYTVALRFAISDDAEGDMLAFFACMGVINLVIFTPIVVLMQLAGSVDIFSITRSVLALALVKGLFDNALSDYLWSKAVLLVGPTMATVGLSIQIPMAMVVDPLVHTEGWWSEASACALELFGAASILAGFFIINTGY